jgi:hypothetical protein
MALFSCPVFASFLDIDKTPWDNAKQHINGHLYDDFIFVNRNESGERKRRISGRIRDQPRTAIIGGPGETGATP